MVRVVLAFDSFKDTMSATDLCLVVKDQLESLCPDADIVCMPLSDGGEGFMKTVELATSLSSDVRLSAKQLEVVGPLGEKRIVRSQQAGYGVLHKASGDQGVVEMALASGIELVEPGNRHPLRTTAHGTGQVIRHLYEVEGVTDILLGVGGTVTVDCGLSILYGIGGLDWEFEGPPPTYFTGTDLNRLKRVTVTESFPADLKITIACDVLNPLLGVKGATYVFGPQKGLNPDELADYELRMEQASHILAAIKNRPEISDMPHGGAAGGAPAGLYSVFNNVSIVSGIDLILSITGLPSLLTPSTIVFTGEGCYDSQSTEGKVIGRLKQLTSNLIIICGKNKTEETAGVYDLVSRYGLDRSLHATADCIAGVVREVWGTLGR